MCVNVLPVAGGLLSAGVTYAGGAAQARAEHAAATRAVQRENQINEIKYQNELKIAQVKDQRKADDFTRKLEAHAAAQTALARQIEFNRLAAKRSSIATQQNLKEKFTEVAFEDQDMLIKSIQARGKLLANSNAGQSLLLNLMNVERELGQGRAMLNARLKDANVASAMSQYGIDLDQYDADIRAANLVPAAPLAQTASFAPVRMPELQEPSGDALRGGLLAAAASGLSSGVTAATTLANPNLK